MNCNNRTSDAVVFFMRHGIPVNNSPQSLLRYGEKERIEKEIAPQLVKQVRASCRSKVYIIYTNNCRSKSTAEALVTVFRSNFDECSVHVEKGLQQGAHFGNIFLNTSARTTLREQQDGLVKKFATSGIPLETTALFVITHRTQIENIILKELGTLESYQRQHKNYRTLLLSYGRNRCYYNHVLNYYREDDHARYMMPKSWENYGHKITIDQAREFSKKTKKIAFPHACAISVYYNKNEKGVYTPQIQEIYMPNDSLLSNYLD